MNKIQNTLLLALLVLVSACTNNQKTKSSDYESIPNKSKEIINKQNASNTEQIHTVVVKEVLPTTKYVYLLVDEGEEPFWIATISKDVKIGNTYYYKGGLLKTNFESKEHNRMFDKIYLVSKLVELNHGNTANQQQTGELNKKAPTNTVKTIEQKGSIKISEIVNNPKSYEGKTVQISGVCTKINVGIMDRNWIHIKDGSKDEYDLVVTSDAFVPEGSTISIKATVTLNKDFGAGYKYALILEDGELVMQH